VLSQALYQGATRAAVHHELAALAEARLLVSLRDLVGYCHQRCGPGTAPPRVASIGVPTRDRTTSLAAYLSSYARCARRLGQVIHFTVVDDSPEAPTREANRQVLRSVQSEYGLEVRYAGPGERAGFGMLLAREAGLSPEVVAFALEGGEPFTITTGTSRNALLLDSVGDMMIQVDDDMACRLAPIPGARDGLALFSGHDPTEFWFLSGSTDRATVSPHAEGDLVGLHEHLLGRDLGDCLAAAAQSEINIMRAGANFFTRLASGAGTVLATMAGVVGDSGMGSPLYWLMLEGNSRARLLRCESDYRNALASRQVLRSVMQATISDGSFCMALNLGLDNRRLLPPFFPVLRGQDAVFGALLRACCQGYVGLLPGGVQHQPPPRWFTAEELKQGAARLNTGQLLQLLTGALAPAPGRVADALLALGAALANLAALRPDDFQEQIRLHVWNARARGAAQMEEQLRHYRETPPWWAQDVRQAVVQLRQALLNRAADLPADLCALFGSDGALAALQGLVGKFAALLRAWPDMIEAVRRLRMRGIRLAGPPGES
jgi:hypothetical protein